MSERALTPEEIAEVLVRCRSTLTTVLGDKPGDLEHPARRRILRYRMAEIERAIRSLPRDPSAKYRQLADHPYGVEP